MTRTLGVDCRIGVVCRDSELMRENNGVQGGQKRLAYLAVSGVTAGKLGSYHQS